MPNTREKLMELFQHDDCPLFMVFGELERLVDYLLAHGVTVQDGKPLEEFLHPIDAYKGLKGKYLVFKADTGAKVENCFVLRPDKDPAAVEALRAYANATDNKTLSEDIYNWVGKGETAQRWIPVTERLPENEKDVLICAERRLCFGSVKKTVVIVSEAFHTDGKMNTEESSYTWNVDDIEAPYDEENDAFVIPKGWWETVNYGEEFAAVCDRVTHWMPLPKPPKEVIANG